MGTGLLERNFPESCEHIFASDEGLTERFDKYIRNFGGGAREDWVSHAVYSEAEFGDYDCVVMDDSVLFNSFFGMGMRADVPIAHDKLDEFRNRIGEEYFSESFEPVNNGMYFRRGSYPSEALEYMALISESETDLFYLSSFKDDILGEINRASQSGGHEFYLDSTHHDFDSLDTYLAVSANDFVQDLETLGREIGVEETTNVLETIFEDEFGDSSLLVTQTRSSIGTGYSQVLPPELALQDKIENY